MRVLTVCEKSARVRDAFRARGHEAYSVDIEPTDGDPEFHFQMTFQAFTSSMESLRMKPLDLVIAFPPCTHLSKAGARYWPQKQADGRQMEAARFVYMVDRWAYLNSRAHAIENPVGWLNTHWRKPDQLIHPYMFGDPWKKQTCLWLSRLPLLKPTDIVEPKGHWVDGGTMTRKGLTGRMEGAYEGAVRATNAGRAASRSVTFQGIADAMAEQWGA